MSSPSGGLHPVDCHLATGAEPRGPSPRRCGGSRRQQEALAARVVLRDAFTWRPPAGFGARRTADATAAAGSDGLVGDIRPGRAAQNPQNSQNPQNIQSPQSPQNPLADTDGDAHGGSKPASPLAARPASASPEALPTKPLRLIGGVDVSFAKDDPNTACAALLVMEHPGLEVVYEDYEMAHMAVPYVAGFLAFREVQPLVRLVERLRQNVEWLVAPSEYVRYSTVLMELVLLVDGNGFGLACHLGVLTGIPTIGIGKNMLHIDGLTAEGVRRVAEEINVLPGDYVRLVGSSGRAWGAALKSHEESSKPVFISPGHMISLETAVEVVAGSCRFRVPEPVRQADLRSRSKLADSQMQLTRPAT
eukprot:SM000106S13933  [mRNA]  locus=s106:24678:26824:+ [translate_table: standard]